MPFIYLLPNEVGSYTDNANGVSVVIGAVAQPTSLAPTCVDDTPTEDHDGDLSYVEHTGSPGDTAIIGRRWSFKFPKLSDVGAASVGTITKVTLSHTARRAGPGGDTSHKVFCFNNSSSTLSDFGTPISTPTSHTTNTNVLTTNPITGVAWVPSDFEGRLIEFGTRRESVGASIFLTQLYLLVEYTELPWAPQPAAKGTWTAEGAASGAWTSLAAGYGTWSPQ